MLEPEISEEAQGAAEVLQLFKSSKLGTIAGCMVRSGTIRREDPVRLIRAGKVIHEGRLESLRRVKDDVREVKEGFECGMRILGYDDVQVEDRIESFRKVEKRRFLGEAGPSS
jgi:translation initiation factor IF-2